MQFTIGIKPGQAKSEYVIDLIHHCNKFIYYHSKPMMQQESFLIFLLDGPRTQKDIQEHFGIQAASVSEIITKLEIKGDVSRCKNDEDRRCVLIVLTEQGRKKAQRLSEHGKKYEAPVCLSEEQMDQLIALLEELHRGFSKNIEKKDLS